MDKNEYLSVIEGMLYIYGDEGVTIKDVAEALEITKKEAYELMDELLSYYASKTVKGVDICDHLISTTKITYIYTLNSLIMLLKQLRV